MIKKIIIGAGFSAAVSKILTDKNRELFEVEKIKLNVLKSEIIYKKG